jgi:hypothetical protein
VLYSGCSVICGGKVLILIRSKLNLITSRCKQGYFGGGTDSL